MIRPRKDMPRARLSADDIAIIVELRENGWSVPRIARKFCVSRGAIDYHCLKHGAEPPKTLTRPAALLNGPQVIFRNGRPVRRFTEDEDRKLLQMEEAGASLSEIGRHLGRKHNVVSARLMTLARREERLAS